MTTITAPLSRQRQQSLLGKIAARAKMREKATKVRSRLAAAISDHAMTFGALAAVDVGMFHLGTTQGWVSVGVSLLLADFKLQG